MERISGTLIHRETNARLLLPAPSPSLVAAEQEHARRATLTMRTNQRLPTVCL
jgi:hypothetical protein